MYALCVDILLEPTQKEQNEKNTKYKKCMYINFWDRLREDTYFLVVGPLREGRGDKSP